ncbi:MAG: L,D-transpeptidase family protein [Planctomycetota bacterium]
MKKFLIMAALVAAASYLVQNRLLPLWSKDKPVDVSKTKTPPSPAADVKKDTPPPLPLTDGLALVAEKKFTEAIPVLVREVDELEAKGSPDAARHIAALAGCHDAVGSVEKAAEAWNRLLTRYPGAPEKAEALYWLARHAVNEEEAAKLRDRARECPGDSEAKRLADADAALDKAAGEGREFEARADLSRVLRAGLPPEKARTVMEELGRLNQRLLWTRIKTPDSIEYEVQAGDTLTRIAQQHKTTVGMIMRINRLASSRIRQGDRFKLISCEQCEVIVRKSDLTLQLWLAGNFIKQYPVCIGDPENSPTPEDEFKVGARMENPPWKDIPPGDPKNILGTRWMGFSTMKSYGIHGTTQPETVPGKKSAGCVRMLNADVEEVYDFAIEGTRITILP